MRYFRSETTFRLISVAAVIAIVVTGCGGGKDSGGVITVVDHLDREVADVCDVHL